MKLLDDLQRDWRAYREEANRTNVTDLRLLTRYFFAWRRSFLPNSSPTNDRLAWFTFPAIDILKKKVSAQSRVFEYGAGGSTLFFLDQGAKLVTVDHEPRWLEEVSRRIGLDARKRWAGHLVLPESDPEAEGNAFDDPGGYVSQDEQMRGLSLQKYAKTVDQFPDGYFDVVVVDGRARPSCAKHARSKVKPGGLLVLDNSERDYYWRVGSDLSKAGWKSSGYMAPGPYNRYFWMTSIFQKPDTI